MPQQRRPVTTLLQRLLTYAISSVYAPHTVHAASGLDFLNRGRVELVGQVTGVSTPQLSLFVNEPAENDLPEPGRHEGRSRYTGCLTITYGGS